MKAVLRRAARVVRVVIHDPQVDREARSFAILIAVRVLIALGASAEVIDIVRQIGA